MAGLSGAAIRALVDKLPPHVFDQLCADCDWLLDGLKEWQTDYIKFEEIDDNRTPDDVAKDYGYDTFEEWQETGCWCELFDDGVLVIE